MAFGKLGARGGFGSLGVLGGAPQAPSGFDFLFTTDENNAPQIVTSTDESNASQSVYTARLPQ